ncbi:ent-kaurene synthase [Rhypophila sp. PSN 637]
MIMEHAPSSPSATGNVSTMLHIEDLEASAKSLLQTTVGNYHPTFGTGSMSCSIYDTAWSGVNGQPPQWLFPECFFYILETQSDDGSWGLSGGSQIDGILCTAASLLSLLRHQSTPLQLDETIPGNLSNRAAKALTSLRSQLQAWDVVSTVHEYPSMDLNFDGFDDLMKINAKKMSRFRAEHLYAKGAPQSTVLHSLEAFVDMDSEHKVDFDKIVHHKRLGSMMGSPASTAAYLMNVSRWDDEAEGYLTYVVKNEPRRGDGGVPSAYPSTYFEFSWVLSTLLTSGFSLASLESPALSKMVHVLSRALENEGGSIGFAPHFLADVDDTAKAITCLAILEKDTDPAKMIEIFEGETHFKTYLNERNPSFSANCNALLALLHQRNPQKFAAQINKAIQDKWNMSNLYPTLLFVDALVTLVRLTESGDLPVFQDETIQPGGKHQNTGSWNGSLEETAYGTMILSQATRLELFQDFDEQFHTAIHRAISFLQSPGNRFPDKPERHLWVEKVGYSSLVLAETYRLSALRRAAGSQSLQIARARVGSTLRQDTSAIPQLSNLLHRTPLFKSTPRWEIRASMVEGTLFRPIIRALRLSVFTRKGVEEDKYFDVIPLAWPLCNSRTRIFAPPCFLFEGMMAAMLNYQVDEFMEAVAGVNYAGDIPEPRKMIDEVVAAVSHEIDTSSTRACNDSNGDDLAVATNGNHSSLKKSNGHGNNAIDVESNSKQRREEVLLPLQKFCRRALHHPAIQSASSYDRRLVTSELRIYLQTHVTQSEDNLLLQQGKFRQSTMMRDDHSFFRWVRTTSADHTSATYTFYFWACLLSSWVDNSQAQKDCFESTLEKYYAAATCQHMATLCRMYNDLGSISRDRDEGNLNSVDFPEFDNDNKDSALDAATANINRKRDELFQLAQYERSCLEDAFSRLARCEASTGTRNRRKERKMDILRLLWNVTDLWGQMYVLRDLGSRLTANGNNNNKDISG